MYHDGSLGAFLAYYCIFISHSKKSLFKYFKIEALIGVYMKLIRKHISQISQLITTHMLDTNWLTNYS